jgi:hypothetical protein
VSALFKRSASEPEASGYLPLDPELAPEELIKRLQINALKAHQVSVGRGDQLVQILERTIHQLERTHNRIQAMSLALFLVGIALLGFAVYESVFADQASDVSSAVLGGVGVLSAFVATFWTAPVEKISDSVSDLVKLETAFLGYIRLIGEVDSAFQMQYLDLLAHGAKSNIRLDQLTQDTTRFVSDAMKETIELVHKYTAENGHALGALDDQMTGIEERVTTLEAKSP